MNPGPWQLAIILVIVLVLFGGAKLPQLARSLGEAQREFRKGQDEIGDGSNKSSDNSTEDDTSATGTSTNDDA
ncbi:MAG: twin-arginine translocase TatA/TatE family subunit [Acidimicrobiales bacterium]